MERDRTARRRSHRARRRCATQVRQRQPHALPKDVAFASAGAAHGESARSDRASTGPARHAAAFPAAEGGYIDLANWRSREWYDALDAAGIAKRGPYHLRHTFATEALAAGVSIFELSRLMGTSVAMIDRQLRAPRTRLRGAIPARLDASDGPGAFKKLLALAESEGIEYGR